MSEEAEQDDAAEAATQEAEEHGVQPDMPPDEEAEKAFAGEGDDEDDDGEEEA